jgi:hypothetical protein
MGSNSETEVFEFSDSLGALLAMEPCCSQVEQYGLAKEAVAPPLMVFPSTPAFFLGASSQDASQPSSDRLFRLDTPKIP